MREPLEPASNRSGSASPAAGPANPIIRSHYIPRTRRARWALGLFLLLLVLAQPPIVHGPANRIEPWILGLPFLYAYLLLVYIALIVVLIWAAAGER